MHELPIQDHAAADAGSHRNADQRAHTAAGTEPKLAESGRIHIIFHPAWQSGTFLHQPAELCPRIAGKVPRRIDDVAGLRIYHASR